MAVSVTDIPLSIRMLMRDLSTLNRAGFFALATSLWFVATTLLAKTFAEFMVDSMSRVQGSSRHNLNRVDDSGVVKCAKLRQKGWIDRTAPLEGITPAYDA